jgi:hypothetical protein
MGRKATYSQWFGFVKEVTTRDRFSGGALCSKYGITNSTTAAMREMGYLKGKKSSECVYIGPRPKTDADLHKLAKEVRSAALNRNKLSSAKYRAHAANAKGTQTELKVQYVPAPKHIPQPQPVGLVRRFIRWIW